LPDCILKHFANAIFSVELQHLGDYLYRTAPADNAMIGTGTFA